MTAPTRAVITIDGPIARLTLRSADGAGRIGAEAIADLRRGCDELTGHRTVRVLVVASEGEAFSPGWSPNLLEMAAAGDASLLPGDVFGCLAALPLPVIAEISGDAVSAGLELALACDLRVAAAGAHFAFPESEFGLIPLAGGSQRLPRLVGRGRALAMLLLGQTIDADTAKEWGLVNERTDESSATAETARIAGIIAGRGPIAERFAKEAVQFGTEMPLARALKYELDLTVLLQTTEDRAEGVRAFTEKRPPTFTGR